MTTPWTLTDGRHSYRVPASAVPEIKRQLEDIDLQADKPIVEFVPVGSTDAVRVTLSSATVLHSATGEIFGA